jgi:hypothetical protein
MKKILVALALIFTTGFLNAAPGRGGYMGHRILICAEGAYSPFYTSVSDFFTKYNFQYGGNLGIIVGRRAQLNVNYNMWSLGGNELYNENFVAADRIKGNEFGLSLKKFRKERGGIAPIGKFYEIGLSYSQNEFVASSGSKNVVLNTPNSNFSSNMLLAHVSFGTQMIFWDHLVANTGIRFGSPIIEVSASGDTSYGNEIISRMRMKEAFSVFFGVGVLL